MAADLRNVLKKLDRPPSGPNWVRFVQDDVPSTTKAVVSFVKSIPPFTYTPGYAAIKDRVQLGIDLDTALTAVRRCGAPAGRPQNEDLVKAFFEHDDARGYAAANAIEFEKEWFRVSRDIVVPVSPLSVIRESGKFVPLFVCGWSELKLTDYQRRLLVTICEDAFLSLTDYQSSPAEFLFFPRVEGERTAEVWQRGDYELLSDRQLNESLEIYLESRELARTQILKEIAAQEADQNGRRDPPSTQGTLFPDDQKWRFLVSADDLVT